VIHELIYSLFPGRPGLTTAAGMKAPFMNTHCFW